MASGSCNINIFFLCRVQNQLANCALRSWDEHDSSFFSQHKLFYEHMSFVAGRSGGLELSLDEAKFSDTVTALQIEKKTCKTFPNINLVDYRHPICVKRIGQLLTDYVNMWSTRNA